MFRLVGRSDGIYPAGKPITFDALLKNETFEELEGAQFIGRFQTMLGMTGKEKL